MPLPEGDIEPDDQLENPEIPRLYVEYEPAEPWVLELPDGSEHVFWEPFGFGRGNN